MSKKSKGGAGPEKTNAARLLDKAGVNYRLVPYEVDENDLSAVHVAATLGEDIDLVYKTLVHTAEVKNGCILTGTQVPAILTSRSDTFETKVYSLALAAVVAEEMQKNQK